MAIPVRLYRPCLLRQLSYLAVRILSYFICILVHIFVYIFILYGGSSWWVLAVCTAFVSSISAIILRLGILVSLTLFPLLHLASLRCLITSHSPYISYFAAVAFTGHVWEVWECVGCRGMRLSLGAGVLLVLVILCL